MDSQLTLVDARAPTPSEETIILTFDKDDMTNTTLHICGTYLPSYIVDTLDNVTTISAGDCLLATVTRRMFRRDQITFPGFKPINLGSWLKAPILSSLPLVFRACGTRFEWKEDHTGQLLLCESGRPGDTLAWFARSHNDFGDYQMHGAYLAIKPEMGGMTDLIVLSCLLAEHKLRDLTFEQGIPILHTMVTF